MTTLFAFDGELGRRRYALLSWSAFFAQHLIVWLVFALSGRQLHAPWWFWLTPLRALVFQARALQLWVVPAAMVLTVFIDWLLVAWAFRRARQAGLTPGLAALAVAPVLQLLALVWLSVAPPRTARESDPPSAEVPLKARVAAQGLLVAASLSVAAVSVSALMLGLYGYGLFVASPFVIGLTTGYLANRRGDIGLGRTWGMVFAGLGLGALALIGLAFEGVICLVLASPLILFMGFIGGLMGQAIALMRRPGRTTLTSFAVVPLLLTGEVLLPPQADFESVESVDVAARPAAVWESVVHMGPIPGAPAVPFRWGLAYPVRGEIIGSGVGAIRRGVFSTGVAYERVTEWRPERKLSFVVLSDPPTMREMSPYSHVNAPHLNGYFRTLDARFTVTPLVNGMTRLTLATHHELDLEPALYWMPIAQWATHANKVRVLNHFREQAESGRGPN